MFPTQFIQLDGQAVKSVALFPICRLDDVSLGEPEPDLLLQVRWLHGGVTAVNKTNSNEIKKNPSLMKLMVDSRFPGEKTQPVDIGQDAESDEEILRVEDVTSSSLHLLS